MKNLLIITGCVNVKNKKVKIVNAEERLKQYKETLRWAIEDSNFDIIIFCENSSCQYDFNEYVNKINKYNKTFEYLSFEGSDKTSVYGIGYGEIEIIKYAYNNSNYFKFHDNFWKLTGRLKIKNINKILQKTKNRNIVYLSYYKWFDTRFYKMPINIYKDFFMNADEYFKINQNNMLEKIYYKIFRDNMLSKKIKGIKNCPNYPIYVGVSGSLAKNYAISNFKYNINNLLCKFNLFNNQFIQHMYIILFNRN